MVNLLSKDQLGGMSPEGRIKNSYESLYYRTPSGDPEVDEILRQDVLMSFKEHDVLLADKPEPEKLRAVLLHAAKESTKELQRDELSPEQAATIERDFDQLTSRPRFYETTFDSFEKRHFGEPVDFTADYERMVRENGGKPPWELEMTEEALKSMENEWMDREMEERERDKRGEPVPRAILSPYAEASAPKRSDVFAEPLDYDPNYEDTSPDELSEQDEMRQFLEVERSDFEMAERDRAKRGEPLLGNPSPYGNLSAAKNSDAFTKVDAEPKKAPRSGLSYSKAVPEAVVAKKKPAYVQAAQENAAANEQKGKVDKAYEQHAVKNGNGSKFTAGDQFGYDEPEDDGPEL